MIPPPLQVSPIDIDAWMERKNSINKEVLKFQEELLNYEEDSLNATSAATSTKVAPTNPAQEGTKPSVFQNGFIPGRNNVQNLNDIPPKTKAISAKEKFFKSEPVGLLNRISDSANNNNRMGNQNTDNTLTEVLSRKDRANVAYADKQIEEYEKDMEKLIEENKTADVKLAEYEKGMRETEETKDDPDLALLDLPRKKSVHFEGVSICLSEVSLAWRVLGTDKTQTCTHTTQYFTPSCFREVRHGCFLSFNSLVVSFLFEKVEDSVCERSVGWALLGLSRSQGGEGLFAGSCSATT